MAQSGFAHNLLSKTTTPGFWGIVEPSAQSSWEMAPMNNTGPGTQSQQWVLG